MFCRCFLYSHMTDASVRTWFSSLKKYSFIKDFTLFSFHSQLQGELILWIEVLLLRIFPKLDIPFFSIIVDKINISIRYVLFFCLPSDDNHSLKSQHTAASASTFYVSLKLWCSIMLVLLWMQKSRNLISF